MKNPKHILITGASSGIGEALALHYAAPGIRLALSGRDAARIEAVADACRAKGAEAQGGVLDVRDRDAMAGWIRESDAAQPLDLVVANAGIAASSTGTTELAGMADRVFETNVGGVFATVHPALDLMIPRGRGQIAIVSSIAGYQGLSSTPAYSASKAAVKAYGEALRGRLGKTGVEINVICPGFVVSRITERNTHKMPFLTAADKSARAIARGLARNKGRITYPWQMHLIARLWVNTPMRVMDWVAKHLPEK